MNKIETALTNAAAPAKPKKATLSQAAEKQKKAAGTTTKTTAEIRKEMAENAKLIQGDGKPGQLGTHAVVIVEPLIPSTRPANDIISEKIKFHADGMGVDILESLTVEEFPVVLGYFFRHRQGVNYIIGDLINYGEKNYGAKYTAALEATGLEIKTLMNIASTCKKVSPEMRLLARSYSHAAAVNSLPAGKQKQLLAKAMKEKMPVSKLNALVRVENPPAPRGKKKAGKKSNAAPPPEAPLTAEQQAENDSAIEMADELQTFIRGKDFAKLPPSHLKTWAGILKPFATAYEALSKKGYASK